MSPRKTRRGAKDENNDTLSETISKKSAVETPGENSSKMRTRRQLTKVSSVESEGDQSPDPSNKSTRKIVSGTPSDNKSSRKTVSGTPSKSTRSRKKLNLETTVLDDSVISTAKPRRTRKAKENETLVDQTAPLDSTELDESSLKANKSRGTKGRKKVDLKATGEDKEKPVKRLNASAAKNVTILENNTDITIDDDSDPMSREDAEVLQVSTRISRGKTAAASPAIGNRRTAKHRLEDFTPESSPITVNLTPQRTTKTPRKSPMNLSSPKSHADAPQRLSKTPRKLPVILISPVPSEMSVTSSSNSTPDKPNNLDRKKLKKSGKLRKSPKKSPRKSPATVVSVRKFSKSPKIVLRSPKQKSAKSKSPKSPGRIAASKSKRSSQPKTKSPAKSMKSPIKTPKSPARGIKSPKSPKRSVNDVKKSVLAPGELMSVHLARIDSPRAGKSKLDMVMKKETPDAQPLVTKVSPAAVENPEIQTRTSLRRTPVDSPQTTPAMSPGAQKRSSQGGESPHRAKTLGQKRTAITDSGTPLRPIDSPWNTVDNKAAAGKSIILSSSDTPVDITKTRATRGSGSRMAASTPRERTRRSLNLSPGMGNPSIILKSPVNREARDGNSIIISGGRGKRRSARIDDESNPLISEDDESMSPQAATSPLNGTYELDKDATVVAENHEVPDANGTYELAEPKTPNLRRKAGKRSIDETENSIEDRTAKRVCRVRFASPELNPPQDKTIGPVISRSRTATPRHPVGRKFPHNDSKIPDNQDSRNNSKAHIARRRSNSMSNLAIATTPVAEKRRSNSVSNANARSAQRNAEMASVNRLSRPRLSIPSAKKQEVKTPVARKTPNFAGIHQKQFAKMESLVDAKKRVANRHVAMTSKIPVFPKVKSKLPTKSTVPSQVVDPIVAVNGSYNRYGFKLRKDEAIKMVTKKQPTDISQKKQNENRMILKGVRTNRRFELIMKSRNLNK